MSKTASLKAENDAWVLFQKERERERK